MENDKISQVQEILNQNKGFDNVPQNIKYEKKERGLYERTENSTILITEDNKMMLND